MSSTQKIKFIVDSASDIPDDLLVKYNIDMLSIPITIDDAGYLERQSFSIREFYKLLEKTAEIPKTSRVTMADFYDAYIKAYNEGFTSVIAVTLNAGGSGTNESAQLAAQSFFDENPDAKDRLHIHVVDSKTYTMAYGHAVVESAKMAADGKTDAEIIAYMRDFFDTVVIYLACYNLEYAKKSGRINAAAAFVGDVLGLKPIIAMIDGQTKVISKVRGDKSVVPELVKCYKENHDPNQKTTVIVSGDIENYNKELAAELKKIVKTDIPCYDAGAAIVINAGPKCLAVICQGKKRK